MPYKDKNKQREFNRIWIQNRRLEFFKDKKCIQCWSIERMELHHVDKSQKIDHRIWSWKKERIDDETKKCIVLCRICHEDLHAKEMVTELIHGTWSWYKKWCRCELCKKYQSNRMKKYRKNIWQKKNKFHIV